MIVSNPSDEALQGADTIALFDPGRPEWHEIVIAAGARPRQGQSYTVLDIPVDSADETAVQGLRDRINAVRR